MKRIWIWGTCVTLISGGALALAQQEGVGPVPPAPPVAAAGTAAPLPGLPPVSPPAAVAPVAGVAGTQATSPIAPTPPPGAVRASSDPFSSGGGVRAGGQQAAAGGAEWDSVPSQNGPNTGRVGGGRAFSGPAGGFGGGPSSGFGSFGGTAGFGGGQNMFGKAATAEAKAFQEAEQKVQQLAGRIRTTATDSPNYAKVDEELKAAVKAAFEARQAMQKAEVKRLKDKLAEIEAQVTRRESAKEVLIEDRYFDLKNGSGGNAPAGLFGPSYGAFPSPNSFPAPSLFESSSAGGVETSRGPAIDTAPAATSGEPAPVDTIPRSR